MNTKEWLIVLIVSCFITCILTSNHYTKNPITKTEIVRDTTIVVDTITVEKPIYKFSKVVDTIFIHRDSVIVKDSLIYLPKEQKVYSDDSTYMAIVSGYEPNLDKIEVYPKTITITDTKIVRERYNMRWGIGIQAGYGISNTCLSPYIGVGISYNLLNF